MRVTTFRSSRFIATVAQSEKNFKPLTLFFIREKKIKAEKYENNIRRFEITAIHYCKKGKIFG